ncbi:MAG: amidohydrolase [Maribacter sp.]|nr:amidohydrolase [Maribacter sp.]
MTRYMLLSIVFALLVSCIQKIPKADSIVKNCMIWTGNANMPIAEAMAIKADTIIAIGSREEIRKFKGKATQIIDTGKKFITPGFIDAHIHLLMGGNALLSVELRDASTKEEFVSRIATQAKKLDSNAWIVEGNWDHTLWGGQLPTREWIDDSTLENPVAVYRIDGHMILANAVALKIAGIDKDTPDVPNGEIVRHADGTPTGILKSEAMYLVLNKIPPLSETQKERAIKKAQAYLLSQGVTSIHDVDSLGGFGIVQKMKTEDALKIRIYTAQPLDKWNTLPTRARVDGKWLKNGLLKGFVDGSLGSHTAAFLDPYTDKVDDSGIFINDPKDIYQWISEADKQNLQVAVHAIGDRANRCLLNNYQQLIKEQGKKDRRLRIEHAQHLAPEDIKRFANMGIIASVQPYHAIDDGRWAEALIGPTRMKTTYAFNSLLHANATLVFGSDWPVAPASPLKGIYAAVTRRTLDNKNPNGWVPNQKITVEQALFAYTRDAAFASYDEDIKGTLEVGKIADFVVLSENITKVDPREIINIQVLATYVGGKKVYEIQPNKN